MRPAPDDAESVGEVQRVRCEIGDRIAAGRVRELGVARLGRDHADPHSAVRLHADRSDRGAGLK